jgi:hypothetical protein
MSWELVNPHLRDQFPQAMMHLLLMFVAIQPKQMEKLVMMENRLFPLLAIELLQKVMYVANNLLLNALCPGLHRLSVEVAQIVLRMQVAIMKSRLN